MDNQSLFSLYAKIGSQQPLVHCITNYVSAHEVANALLAAGARPFMADHPAESRVITAQSDALYLNIGTVGLREFCAMRRSLKEAKKRKIPVVLDPVGVGSSRQRKRYVKSLLKTGGIWVIRGNSSEIACVASLFGQRITGRDTCGVDDCNPSSEEERIASAKELARATGSVVLVSGARDIITDGQIGYWVENGTPIMKKVTGIGCQMGALCAAFCAANPEGRLQDAVAAACLMGLCGEQAAKGSLGFFNELLIEHLSDFTLGQWEKGARYGLL